MSEPINLALWRCRRAMFFSNRLLNANRKDRKREVNRIVGDLKDCYFDVRKLREEARLSPNGLSRDWQMNARHTYAQIKKLDAQLRDANSFWSSQRRWLFKRHLWLGKELRRLLSLKSSGAAEAIFAPRTY